VIGAIYLLIGLAIYAMATSHESTMESGRALVNEVPAGAIIFVVASLLLIVLWPTALVLAFFQNSGED